MILLFKKVKNYLKKSHVKDFILRVYFVLLHIYPRRIHFTLLRMQLGVHSCLQVKRQGVKLLYELCKEYLNPAKQWRYY